MYVRWQYTPDVLDEIVKHRSFTIASSNNATSYFIIQCATKQQQNDPTNDVKTNKDS